MFEDFYNTTRDAYQNLVGKLEPTTENVLALSELNSEIIDMLDEIGGSFSSKVDEKEMAEAEAESQGILDNINAEIAEVSKAIKAQNEVLEALEKRLDELERPIDDFSKLKGVRQATMQCLINSGLRTFKDIAALTPPALETKCSSLSVREAAAIIKQAKEFAGVA